MNNYKYNWDNVSVNTSFDKEKKQKYKKNKIYQIRCNTCRSLFSHQFVSERDLDTMAKYGLKCDDCEAEDILYGNSYSSSSDELAFLYDSPDSPPSSLTKKKLDFTPALKKSLSPKITKKSKKSISISPKKKKLDTKKSKTWWNPFSGGKKRKTKRKRRRKRKTKKRRRRRKTRC